MGLNFDSKPWDAKVEKAQYGRYSSDLDRRNMRVVQSARFRAKAASVNEQPLPLLQGLLITVDTRQGLMLDPHHGSPKLDTWYDSSDEAPWEEAYKQANTPVNRRVLHTFLSALIECPRTWARSAMTRHLRGTGKQRQTKYTGNGIFGAGSGWGAKDVINVLKVLMETSDQWGLDVRVADSLCTQVEGFGGYPSREVREEAYQKCVDPFAVTQTKRNTRLLKVLCTTLEHMGLGPELQRPASKASPK